MTYRQFPPPPIEKFQHGAVWRIMLEEFGENATKNTYAELVREKDIYEMLVLLTAPWREWPTTTNYYWRSRLLVGDRRRRTDEDILKDFRHLLLQTPPVLRNWRRMLHEGTFKRRLYHLVWMSQVELITV